MAIYARFFVALVALCGFVNASPIAPSVDRNLQSPAAFDTQNTTPETQSGLQQADSILTGKSHLVFQMNGWALTNNGDVLIATNATAVQKDNSQRFTLNQKGTRFSITSVVDNYTVNDANSFLQKPGITPSKFSITKLANDTGYSVQTSSGKYFSISLPGRVTIGTVPFGFKIRSVT